MNIKNNLIITSAEANDPNRVIMDQKVRPNIIMYLRGNLSPK